jgi:hypothetical protein
MKRIAILFVVTCLLFVSLSGIASAVKFSGGSGFPEDPYRLSNSDNIVS